MNILQKILGTIFPPYKFNVLRREEEQLLNAIVAALPAELSVIKERNAAIRLWGLSDWSVLYPGFQFVSMGFTEEEYRASKKPGLNLKITGLKIYSKRTRNFEDLELLVKNNLICGLRISNYELSALDLNQISSKDCMQSNFEFPPDPIDLFYDALPQEIKNKLAIEDLEEIEFNNRTFYSFYDLEDGNYLAVDKNAKVYSLVHDAKPMAKGLKIAFIDMLNEIANNQFDSETHLNERYKSSK